MPKIQVWIVPEGVGISRDSDLNLMLSVAWVRSLNSIDRSLIGQREGIVLAKQRGTLKERKKTLPPE